MSTFPTDSDVARSQSLELRLADIQSRIVINCASIEDLQREITLLRYSNPITRREVEQRNNAIRFKEDQANQLVSINNVLEAKARYLAQLLDIPTQ